ncbi:hypothetical protein ABT126_22450 [Streptomyces sp. NPDC002012]|uniref:hypothetical protein n=1 Tax=Streptomyces sp. NPDC002012 TaxID=3154532 RepID=UPI00331AA336
MPEEVTDTRPSRTWIASLISTIVTLPLAFFALVFGGLSPMACDSCEDAEAHRFDTSFDPAWTVLTLGLVLALITLVTSWALSRRRPPAALALAVLAPSVVFFAWVTFMALVDWP